MRCLHCGKELALLKRWTGGGEFCSDAHRQLYQEEYNKLALNRLLQAKPTAPEDPKQRDAKRQAETMRGTPQPAQDAPPATLRPNDTVHRESTPPAVRAAAKPVEPAARIEERRKTAQAPEPTVEKNTSGDSVTSAAALRLLEAFATPAEAPTKAGIAPPGPPDPEVMGFVADLPLPAVVPLKGPVQTSLELITSDAEKPSIPGLAFAAQTYAIPFAPGVPLQLSDQIRDSGSRSRDVKAEIRDFVRGTPTAEVALPSVPGLEFGAETYAFQLAPEVALHLSDQIHDSGSRSREGNAEIRDFVRGTPVVEISLPGAGATGLGEPCFDVLEDFISPRSASAGQPWRQDIAAQFSAQTIELGSLIALDFATTGFEEAPARAEDRVVGDGVTQDGEDERGAGSGTSRTSDAESNDDAQSKDASEKSDVSQRKTIDFENPFWQSPAPVVSIPRHEPLPKNAWLPIAPVPVGNQAGPGPANQETPARETSQAGSTADSPAERSSSTVSAVGLAERETELTPLPDLATRPLPFEWDGIAAAEAKPCSDFSANAEGPLPIQVPRSETLPLRPVMILGPAPEPTASAVDAETAATKAEIAASKAELAASKAELAATKAEFAATMSAERGVSAKMNRPAVRIVNPQRKEATAPARFEPAPATTAVRNPPENGRSAVGRNGDHKNNGVSDHNSNGVKTPLAPSKREEPAPPAATNGISATNEVKDHSAHGQKEDRKPATATITKERSKLPETVTEEKKPAQSDKPALSDKASIPGEATSTAKSSDRETPRAEPEKQQPVRASLPAPLAAPYEAPDLGLPTLNLKASNGFWARSSMAVKIAVMTGAMLAAAGIYYATTSGPTKPAAVTPPVPKIVDAGPPLPSVGSDWLEDFSPAHARQISVLRDSLRLADYRIEFSSQLNANALGWVFRAQDSQNFYVAKVEVVKSGPAPTLAVAHFAVIGGTDQPAVRRPLTIAVSPDKLYKIRFQAMGDHFTTWIQDQQVDDWTDAQIHTGGAGLFAERGERSVLQGKFSVVPLAMK